MFVIVIDGIQVPKTEHDWIEDTIITKTQTGTDQTKRKRETIFSKQIVFYGETFKYLKAKLVDTEDFNTLIVEIYDNCCGQTEPIFYGKITKESIDYCVEVCSITADIKENSERTVLYSCLELTYIWANGPSDPITDSNFANNVQHPFVRHCIEFRPGILQAIIYYLSIVVFFALIPLIIVVGAIVTVINVIITAINGLIPGGGNDISLIGDGDINFFDDIQDLTQNVFSQLIGCGRGNPAPYVSSYLDHVCGKCGLTWQSDTILNKDFGGYQPYKNLVLFHAPTKKGKFDAFNWQEENKPLFTGEAFANFLSEVFNGAWKVNELGVLQIERKDFFSQNNNNFDLRQIPKDDIISECYTYSEDKKPASAEVNYTKDGIDWVGDEAFYIYSDTVTWGMPRIQFPNFEGIRTITLPIGPVRFTKDNVDDNVLEFFINFLGRLPANGSVDLSSLQENTVLMPQHTFSQYKLLAINPAIADVYNNAKTWDRGTAQNVNGNSDIRTFNSDMWISAVNNSEVKPHIAGNLYDRFWYIEDSRLQNYRGQNFEVKLRKKCEYINAINLDTNMILSQSIANGIVKYLGVITEISIETDVITIKGTL